MTVGQAVRQDLAELGSGFRLGPLVLLPVAVVLFGIGLRVPPALLLEPVEEPLVWLVDERRESKRAAQLRGSLARPGWRTITGP